MRIKEIILEDFDELDSVGDNTIEDEADTRGDSALITSLEWLRNEAEDSGAVTPRVKVDTIIDRVRAIPGNEAFNYSALESAKQHNDIVKSLIKDIKDDEQTGAKYVYLVPAESNPDSSDPLGAQGAPAGDPSKIVSSMAKRAVGN
jgi:hypothetical protein